ncbi:MAG: hypothetical protein U0401_07125 [Anaerolineae bacterium]
MAVLAVDIGGTNLRTALFRTPGEILDHHSIPCRKLVIRFPWMSGLPARST